MHAGGTVRRLLQRVRSGNPLLQILHRRRQIRGHDPPQVVRIPQALVQAHDGGLVQPAIHGHQPLVRSFGREFDPRRGQMRAELAPRFPLGADLRAIAERVHLSV